MLDHLFKSHAVRGFYKDDVTRLQQGVDTRKQLLSVREIMDASGRLPAAFFCSVKRSLIHGGRKRSRTDDAVRSLLNEITSYPLMKRLLFLSQLKHISEHSDGAAGFSVHLFIRAASVCLGQKINGSLHGNRIGIVAVVNKNPALRLYDAAPAADALRGCNAVCDLFFRQSQQNPTAAAARAL